MKMTRNTRHKKPQLGIRSGLTPLLSQPLLQSNPLKISCLHPKAVRGCRQETFAYSRWSNRPCPVHGQTIRGACNRVLQVGKPGQTGPLLAPLKAVGGQERTCCGYIREGASGERSDCRSHDGLLSAGVRPASRSRRGRVGASHVRVAKKHTYWKRY